MLTLLFSSLIIGFSFGATSEHFELFLNDDLLYISIDLTQASMIAEYHDMLNGKAAAIIPAIPNVKGIIIKTCTALNELDGQFLSIAGTELIYNMSMVEIEWIDCGAENAYIKSQCFVAPYNGNTVEIDLEKAMDSLNECPMDYELSLRRLQEEPSTTDEEPEATDSAEEDDDDDEEEEEEGSIEEEEDEEEEELASGEDDDDEEDDDDDDDEIESEDDDDNDDDDGNDLLTAALVSTCSDTDFCVVFPVVSAASTPEGVCPCDAEESDDCVVFGDDFIEDTEDFEGEDVEEFVETLNLLEQCDLDCDEDDIVYVGDTLTLSGGLEELAGELCSCDSWACESPETPGIFAAGSAFSLNVYPIFAFITLSLMAVLYI